jgi:endonuclease/exonuclease/phosphatase family metal-dependent hydrolase
MTTRVLKRSARLLAAATLLACACGPKVTDRAGLPAECPHPQDHRLIRWYQVEDSEERAQLIRWCSAVGPAVVDEPPPTQPPTVDSLAVVSWNTHVGGGALGYFIRQLRTGVLNNARPVPHFVILLQETYRTGPEIPARLPADALYADPIFPTRELGIRRDVREMAEEYGLFVYYVPSMRNGGEDGPPEDRGNAILSTLPLSDFTAWELPYRFQRRVTIGASVQGVTSSGVPWRLRFLNIHLDHRTGIRAFVTSFGAVREEQVEFLLERFPADGAAVAGGDFNTWLGEYMEGAIDRVREVFPEPREIPRHGTVKFGPVLERQTDFLFFRLPPGWRGHYRRIDDTYGSDHYPLLGWIRFGEEPPAEED